MMANELQISQHGIEMPVSPIRKLAPMAYAAEDRGIKNYRLNIGRQERRNHHDGTSCWFLFNTWYGNESGAFGVCAE